MGNGVTTGLIVFDKLVNLGNRLVECYETSKRLDVEIKKIDSKTRVSLAEINKEKLRIDKAYRLCREGLKNLSENYIQTLKELSCSGEECRKCIAACREDMKEAFKYMVSASDAEFRQQMKDFYNDCQNHIKDLADKLKINNDQIITNAAQHIKELPNINIKETKLISDK